MKVVVFAYHDMGLAGLAALERAGMDILCVFSHEDDPDEKCWFGSVRRWAEARGIPIFCPEDVNQAEWIARIASFGPEMIFSFYYRHILTTEILQIAPGGAYNLHGSLLPAYRGRCPVNWVLVRGERQTGVTLHHMIAKSDAGDIVGQKAVPIELSDRAVTLYSKLCRAADELMDDLLPRIMKGTAPRIEQDLSKGSYYGGRRPEDGRIDWHWNHGSVYNLIRAVTDPYPGAFGFLPGGQKLMIWWAEMAAETSREVHTTPGLIRKDGDDVLVETGGGPIRLIDVEVEGQKLKGAMLNQYFKGREGQVLT